MVRVFCLTARAVGMQGWAGLFVGRATAARWDCERCQWFYCGWLKRGAVPACPTQSGVSAGTRAVSQFRPSCPKLMRQADQAAWEVR